MKKIIAISLFAAFVVTLALLTLQGVSFVAFGRRNTNDSVPTENVTLVAGSEAAFNYLSQQRTNICGLRPELVLAYPDDMQLQGSCCSPMALHPYQEQVEGLRQYSDIPQIPEDPYDISASLAKELLGYQASIQLTSEQQAIYDEAIARSEEGGPCCCRCWRWYAFEGLGKYLITQQGWSAQQLAELWSLTDGCGGEGHQHG
jgi:hypothetical protein